MGRHEKRFYEYRIICTVFNRVRTSQPDSNQNNTVERYIRTSMPPCKISDKLTSDVSIYGSIASVHIYLLYLPMPHLSRCFSVHNDFTNEYLLSIPEFEPGHPRSVERCSTARPIPPKIMWSDTKQTSCFMLLAMSVLELSPFQQFQTSVFDVLDLHIH